jgi:hypothetical protein
MSWFEGFSTSEAWALSIIAIGVGTLLLSRFSDSPIRFGGEGGDDDDRVLDRRSATILGIALVVSGALVFLVDWLGWVLVAASFVWGYRSAN